MTWQLSARDLPLRGTHSESKSDRLKDGFGYHDRKRYRKHQNKRAFVNPVFTKETYKDLVAEHRIQSHSRQGAQDELYKAQYQKKNRGYLECSTPFVLGSISGTVFFCTRRFVLVPHILLPIARLPKPSHYSVSAFTPIQWQKISSIKQDSRTKIKTNRSACPRRTNELPRIPVYALPQRTRQRYSFLGTAASHMPQ